MYEHLEFLHGSYLTTSKEALESIMKVFNSKLVDKVGSGIITGGSNSNSNSNNKETSKDSSRDDVNMRGSIIEHNTIIENNEHFNAAVSVSTSWEAARASRSSLMLQLMIDTAQSMANDYKEITKQWEYAYTKLGGVERDPV